MWVCSSNGPNTANYLFFLTFYKSLDTEVRDKAFSFSFYIYFFLKSPLFSSLSIRLSTRFLPSPCLQLFADPLLPFLADCSYLFTTSAVMRYGCECSGHINAALISCWLIKMYCVAFIWAVFSFIPFCLHGSDAEPPRIVGNCSFVPGKKQPEARRAFKDELRL